MKAYNPLEKENLAKSVALSLIRQPMVSLAEVRRFKGAGVYAIYYAGPFAAYGPLVRMNVELSEQQVPIYVGKGIPKGGRKGVVDADQAERSTALSGRLLEHQKSIEQATNLELSDFQCRYLIVDDVWIPLGESLLIQRFLPLWNTLVEGFGNHDPGKGRYKGAKPLWHLLHPGAEWAEKCRPPSMQEQDLRSRIQTYWDSYVTPSPIS